MNSTKINHGFALVLLIEYNVVFDDEPSDLLTYLTGISRSTVLRLASFFLAFNTHKSKYKNYRDLLSMFFSKENEIVAKEINTKLEKVNHQYPGGLVIINPQSALQLFEFCFDKLTDSETQTKAQIEINIFKACLLLNQQNTNREQSAFSSNINREKVKNFAYLSLAQSMPSSELLNYNMKEILIGQLIKSVFLFEFLDSTPETKVLLNRFLSYYNCKDWKQYLKFILPLAFTVLKSEDETYYDIIVEQGNGYQESCDFIEKLAICESDEINEYDFKVIRSRPFYRVSNGVYRIIFGLFAMEKIHKGLFFKLDEINKAIPSKERKIKNLRSFYCDEFSEKYLLYRLLESIYKGRYVEYSGAKIKESGIDAEPDYYIRNGNHIFLFESKDILINAEIKPTYDFSLYEQEFQKKLYYDIDDKGKVVNKAVFQLINNIKRVLSNEFSFDSNYKAHSVYIYPIVVLHDHQFNVAGLNVLVNDWYQNELNKLKEANYNTARVQPIVIIDIDTLIFHQDLLRERSIRLETILDEYFKFITFNFKKKYRNENHSKQYYQRTVVPFSVFLHNYVNDKGIKKVPKMLMEKGMSLFE